MKTVKVKVFLLTKEIFQFSLVIYLILFLIETYKMGTVSYFFNLHLILVVIILSGMLMLLTNTDKEIHNDRLKLTSAYIQNTFIIAVISSVLVYYKTISLGNMAFVVAGITWVMIMFLSVIIVLDKE
jgi:hypothetical protein